ncbi:MAG: hypothetical protein AAFQ64_18145 [Pseudomonadota bacterium]
MGRMKGGVQHRVPLTDEMLRILEGLKPLGGDHVFPAQKRGAPLSNMSMLMLLRRMGQGQFTVHGFRSMFRDWASEEVGAPREVAESALAHQVGSEVERAYARSDLLERRAALMRSWSIALAEAHLEKGGTLFQGLRFILIGRMDHVSTFAIGASGAVSKIS